MSLTNPKDVVTEERLKDFYDGIYPYLGGMPEILANKFSRSDIYSTTEKMIGQWTDGKPLYQKVITGTTSSSASSTNLGNASSLIGSNISDIFIKNAWLVRTNGAHIPLGVSYNNYTSASSNAADLLYGCYVDASKNIWSVVNKESTASLGATVYIVVCYTKTTDSAISIGVDTDYSTTEKIVGTWIDGKYIYQKTINVGALPNSATALVNHNISNIDKIVGIKAVGISSTGECLPIPYTYASGSQGGTVADNIKIGVSTTEVSIATGKDRSSITGYVTLQYTKTS